MKLVNDIDIFMLFFIYIVNCYCYYSNLFYFYFVSVCLFTAPVFVITFVTVFATECYCICDPPSCQSMRKYFSLLAEDLDN